MAFLTFAGSWNKIKTILLYSDQCSESNDITFTLFWVLPSFSELPSCCNRLLLYYNIRTLGILTLAESNSVKLGKGRNKIKTILLYSDQCSESNDVTFTLFWVYRIVSRHTILYPVNYETCCKSRKIIAIYS